MTCLRNTTTAGELVRLVRSIAVAALAAPLQTWGQTVPSHDMRAMPGMSMESPRDKNSDEAKKAKVSGKKPPRAAPPVAPSASASSPMRPDVSRPAPAVDHGKMPGMDHDMSGMAAGGKEAAAPGSDPDHASMPEMDRRKMPGTGTEPSMDMGEMKGMAMDAMMKSMQGGPPPVGARDPNAYAEGLDNGHMPGMDMADDATHVHVLVDRVEQFHSSRADGQAVDAQAWAGGDIDKVWLKVDGERSNGRLGATRTEALWNHAIATYWGLQAGARHDFGNGPGRTWASIGLQGLSPYWFDIQATAYVGQSGRTALRFEGEYDLLLTQRLVLQPDVKVSLYGKNDPEREIGAGLSDIDAGLRLRYEFSRKFAPYIGVVWKRKFANTARYARESGNDVQETRIVAGLRIWF